MRAIFAVLVAAAAGVATWFVPLSWAQTTRPMPVATACTTSTADAQCISANPTRKFIKLCNVSNSVIWIAPGTAAAVANAGNSYPLAAISSNVATCYNSATDNPSPTTPQGGTNAGNSWHALSISSAGVLLIWEYD